MKHKIKQKSFLIGSKWVCSCGHEGQGPDQLLKHQLLTIEGDVKKQITKKVEWSISYMHGMAVWKFFRYTNEKGLPNTLKLIGECINEHLGAGFHIKEIRPLVRDVSKAEYKDWEAFSKFTEVPNE